MHSQDEVFEDNSADNNTFIANNLPMSMDPFWRAFWCQNGIRKAAENDVQNLSEFCNDFECILKPFWSPFVASHGGSMQKLSLFEVFVAWFGPWECSDGSSRSVLVGFW